MLAPCYAQRNFLTQLDSDMILSSQCMLFTAMDLLTINFWIWDVCSRLKSCDTLLPWSGSARRLVWSPPTNVESADRDGSSANETPRKGSKQPLPCLYNANPKNRTYSQTMQIMQTTEQHIVKRNTNIHDNELTNPRQAKPQQRKHKNTNKEGQ